MTVLRTPSITTSTAIFSLITFILIVCTSCTSSTSSSMEEVATVETYDSVLANRLGADEYGMHQYVMAFLKKGSNRSLDSAEAMNLQLAHLDNIRKMANEGKLVLAGPFLDTGEIRGIYIFDVTTIEEAEALTNTDPAIKAGSLVMELKPWYGSAALMELNERHKRVTKTHF